MTQDSIDTTSAAAATVGAAGGRDGVDFSLGQLIQRLRVEAGLSQRELGLRVGTTQSGISRLEAVGGTRTRLDTLTRVAAAVERRLVVAFPSDDSFMVTDGVEIR